MQSSLSGWWGRAAAAPSGEFPDSEFPDGNIRCASPANTWRATTLLPKDAFASRQDFVKKSAENGDELVPPMNQRDGKHREGQAFE
jgi:hypothetical protein